MAKASFALTLYLLWVCGAKRSSLHSFIYLCNLGVAVWSLVTRRQQDGLDDAQSQAALRDKEWEMPPITPRSTVFTPRTQAFQTLDAQN